MNKLSLFVTLLFVFTVGCVIAQDEGMSAYEQTACSMTITTRTNQLVALSGISDVSAANTYRKVIANQYRSLNTIHTKRDNQSSALQKQQISDKSTLYSSVQELEAKSAGSVKKHHDNYISNLSKNSASK